VPNVVAVALAAVVMTGLVGCATGPEPIPSGQTPIALPSRIREARTIPLANGSIRIEAVSGRVVPNQPYRYVAFTHCGFVANTFDFDGSFWTIIDSSPAITVQSGNPPPGIDDPEDSGTILLTTADRALWVSRRGAQLTLGRGPGEMAVFGCD
jgi:hypothetical protein